MAFGANYADGKWVGLVAIDQEGAVVWYWQCEDCKFVTADKLGAADGHNVVALAEYTTVVPNSKLLELTPAGDMVNAYAQDCWGGGASFNAFSHECAVAFNAPGGLERPVVTLEYELREYASTTVEWIAGKPATRDHFIGDKLVLWNRAGGGANAGLVAKVATLDHFTPRNNSVRSNNSFTETTAACGTGDSISDALAWSHASSARESQYKSTYIVAYRNLNAVVAYAMDGAGV